jgi:hypothetical protein
MQFHLKQAAMAVTSYMDVEVANRSSSSQSCRPGQRQRITLSQVPDVWVKQPINRSRYHHQPGLPPSLMPPYVPKVPGT